MPVTIKRKDRITGFVIPPELGVETEVVIVQQLDDYMVEGYLNLSNLSDGDTVVVREYIALDGANYWPFISFAYSGPVAEPVVRLHTKTLPASSSYKVTVTQTSGTPKSISYAFIVLIMGEG